MHDWQSLIREETFTTDGTGSYPFSSLVPTGDYERVVLSTEWDRSNQKKIKIVDAQQWQYLKSGMISNTGVYRFARARGDNLIMAVDASGDNLVFEYVSNYYVKSNSGTAQATWQADTDTSYFKEPLLEMGLKYYLKSEYGLPAEDDCDKYYSAAQELMAQEKPMPVIGQKFYPYNSRYIVNIPDSNAGN